MSRGPIGNARNPARNLGQTTILLALPFAGSHAQHWQNLLFALICNAPNGPEANFKGYQRSKRFPSSAPIVVGIRMPTTYQTPRKGASSSGQWKQ